jgi:outer membrane protein
MRISFVLVRVAMIASTVEIAWEQTAPLTLGDAVERSAQQYPAIRSSLEQVSAAASAINVARTAYLPQVDFWAQENRATHNNVFGLLLPQPTIPSISGPAQGSNSGNSIWGSEVGTLVAWEPFDFGLRHANVEIAKVTKDRTNAELIVTRLQVATGTADAFLTLAAAQQTVIAAQAGVERARVLNEVIETLARNELRPGADASRSRAELALARTQQISAEQAAEVARAALAQMLGVDPEIISIQSTPFLQLPPAAATPEVAVQQHPLALAKDAAVAEVQARERALDHSYYPRIFTEGAAYARGTGIQPDGRTGGFGSGLAPNIQNWAVGATVTFPAFDFFSIRAKKQIEVHNERSAAATYAQTVQDLTGELQKAKAVLAGSRRIAGNTPIQLDAARVAEQQARERYRAGLGNITEVAEAQRLLTQAEIDDSLARLGVWRALLGVAAAQGDLSPFIAMAGR